MSHRMQLDVSVNALILVVVHSPQRDQEDLIHLSLPAIIENVEQSCTQMIVSSVLSTVLLPINRDVISLMRTHSCSSKPSFGFIWAIIWGLDDISVGGFSTDLFNIC